MLKRLTALFLFLHAVLLTAAPEFLGHPKDGEQTHCPHKVNVKVVLSDKDQTVAMTIKTDEYNFGWIQLSLPETDSYDSYAGIYGRYRTNDTVSVNTMLTCPIENGQKRMYYDQPIGDIVPTNGEWIDFYLPFQMFVPGRNAIQSFRPAMLSTDYSLEISVGKLNSDTFIEWSFLKLITPEEAAPLAPRLFRQKIRNLLLAEDSRFDSHHPRLLLYGDNLKRIQAKATAGGNEQLAYNLFVKHADNYLRRLKPEAPFGSLLDFKAAEGLTPHQQRGSFEGAMVPLVRPVEYLAAAGLITGDERYSQAAARAIVSMARTLDVNSPQMKLGFYYTRTFYVRALAFAYDWCYHYLTQEERHDVKTTLLGFIDNIYERSWLDNWGHHPLNRVWNWDPGLVSCAGLGVLAMEGETRTDEVARIIEFRRHLRDYLTFGIDFDGCCHEGPSYLDYGIGAGPEFAECLRMQGRGDLFTETNWQNIAPWLIAEIIPTRNQWNNLSDCNYGHPYGCPAYMYTCYRLAELAKTDPIRPGERLPDPADMHEGLDYIQHFRETPGQRQLSYGALAGLMGWLFNMSAIPKTPEGLAPRNLLAYLLFYTECKPVENPAVFLPDTLLFRGRGLVGARTGYDTNAFHLAVEAGPHAAGHDQGDKTSFTLSACGLNVFIDSGYGNDGFPLKSGGTFAHNAVLVDGQGQPCIWHNNSSGEITGFHHSQLLDWIRVDALTAWNINFSQWKNITTNRNMKVAERQFLFVRGDAAAAIPPYLVIYDNIAKNDDDLHDFTWQWHFPGNLKVNASSPDCWLATADDTPHHMLTTALGAAKGSADFIMTVPEDGDYQFFGLTAAGGMDSGKSDSFSVTVNGTRIDTWDTNASKYFAWTPLKNRGEAATRKFTFTKGQTVTVTIHAREPETQLSALMLLPYSAEPPLGQDEVPKNAIVQTADKAVMGPVPLLYKSLQYNLQLKASVAVYPVMTPQGINTQNWFLTTNNGAHPRLQHTVTQVRQPNFLMVIVPRQDDRAPLPTAVKRLDGETPAVDIVWGNHTDRIEFKHSAVCYPVFTRSTAGQSVATWQGLK